MQTISSNRYDVILIGSGVSSLTAAALLAKKGKSVLVLERYRKAGGYLHCFERFGSSFDTGGHYVGSIKEGQPFRVLLEYIGAWRDDIFLPLAQDGFDVFRFPSFQLELCSGLERAIERVARVFPHEREGISNFFHLCTEVARKFPAYQYNDGDYDISVLKYLELSLLQVIEDLIKDPKLRTFLCSYCVLHGVFPKDTPFGFHAMMLDSLLRGPHGFKDGGQSLATALTEAIEAKGGKVLLRHPVTELKVSDGSIVSVKTKNGEEFSGEWVISGIHPKATFRLMDQECVRPMFKSRLENMQETVGFMGIYAVCNKPPPLDVDKNYYHFQSDSLTDYECLLEEQKKDPRRKPFAIYAARNCRTDAPSEKGLYPITIHAPGVYSWFSKWEESRFADRPAEYEDIKAQVCESVMETAEEAWPGLKSSIVSHVTSSPLSNLFYNGSEEGSSYGIYHSIQNTGARALGPRTHLKNLLLTGQSTMFPGILASSISGLRTAGHILGIKPILRELREKLGNT